MIEKFERHRVAGLLDEAKMVDEGDLAMKPVNRLGSYGSKAGCIELGETITDPGSFDG